MARARALIADAGVRLTAAGVDTPALDARVLMGHALGLDAGRLLISDPDVPAAAADAYEALIAGRLRRVPVSRLIGRRGFWTLELAIGPATLDPRPASETLVEVALGLIPDRPGLVLDLGTGSGALLLALLSERPALTGIGVDRSHAAVAIARANAVDLGLAARASFMVGDWADALSGRCTAVLSNPPYIAPEEIDRLAPEVRDHEPRLALDGGPDGLLPYPAIAAAARRLLVPGGPLIVEIGETQADAVTAILSQAGFGDPVVTRDLAGHPRVVSARAP